MRSVPLANKEFSTSTFRFHGRTQTLIVGSVFKRRQFNDSPLFFVSRDPELQEKLWMVVSEGITVTKAGKSRTYLKSGKVECAIFRRVLQPQLVEVTRSGGVKEYLVGGVLGGTRRVAENQAYVLVTKLKTATEGGTDEVVWEAMNVSNSACALQPTTKMRSQGLHASELQALAKQVQALADRKFAAIATQTAQNSRPPEEGKRKPNKRDIFSPPAGTVFKRLCVASASYFRCARRFTVFHLQQDLCHYHERMRRSATPPMTRVKKSLTRSPDGFQPVAEIVKIFPAQETAARDQTCKLCHNLFTTQGIGNHQKRCRGAQTKLSPLLMQLTNLNVSQVIWELSRQLGWQSNSRVLLQRLLALCYLRLRLVCSRSCNCRISNAGNSLLASTLASLQTERTKIEAAGATREKELRNQSVADRTAQDKFVLDLLKQVQAGDKGVANASQRNEPSEYRARSPPGSRRRRHNSRSQSRSSRRRSRSQSRSRRSSRSGRRCSSSRDRNKHEQRPDLSGGWAWVEPGHWEWVYDSW